MKKSSKLILLTAISYIIVEEPELCDAFLKILVDVTKKHTDKQKDVKKIEPIKTKDFLI